MTPDDADVTVAELAEALRNAADGFRTYEAAVELLITGARGYWLRRDPIRRHIDLTRDGFDPDPGPWFAAVDWPAVSNLAASGEGLYDTTSERTVLRVACELAAGWLGGGLASCDQHNSQAIADAVLHAGQVRW